MNQNQRFAVSLHALTLLSASAGPLTSEQIASSVDTNPVVIRRILAELRAAGLVDSKPGPRGGWSLLRDPRRVGLCEVYRALGEADALSVHGHPNRACPVGRRIAGVLQQVFDEAQVEMERSLGKRTLADILNQVRA